MTKAEIREALIKLMVGKDVANTASLDFHRVTGVDETPTGLAIRARRNPTGPRLGRATMHYLLPFIKVVDLEKPPGWKRVTVYGQTTCYCFNVRPTS